MSIDITRMRIHFYFFVCSHFHINCSVSVLKDREERYRQHLNRQFETLSDAKNIEEQVWLCFSI